MGFFLCWAPFHAQRLFTIYLPPNPESTDEDDYRQQIFYWMFIITGIFYYFSSTLNPILYNIMSDRMRNAFKEVICGIKTNKRNSKMNSTVRESHGYVAIKNSNATTNMYLEEDKMQVVKKDMIMTTSNIGNKMMYEINYPPAINCNSINMLNETNM